MPAPPLLRIVVKMGDIIGTIHAPRCLPMPLMCPTTSLIPCHFLSDTGSYFGSLPDGPFRVQFFGKVSTANQMGFYTGINHLIK